MGELSIAEPARARWSCELHDDLESDARSFDGCEPETLFQLGSVFELVTHGLTCGLHFVNAGSFALANGAAFFTIQAPSESPKVIACVARREERILLLHVAPVAETQVAQTNHDSAALAAECGLQRLKTHDWSAGSERVFAI